MKNSFFLLAAVLVFSACSNKDKQNTSAEKKDKKKPEAQYLLSKDGIGELKIGMLQKDVEKLLGQPLALRHAKDTGEIWMDTAVVKYHGMDVELYMQRSYVEGHTDEMELMALSTTSTLCRDASGLGVGDERNAILAAYEDNPIQMGPEGIMINDTTWGLSKTNYYINISDDKWDKQIIFLLVNKKVSSVQASLAMGE